MRASVRCVTAVVLLASCLPYVRDFRDLSKVRVICMGLTGCGYWDILIARLVGYVVKFLSQGLVEVSLPTGPLDKNLTVGITSRSF